jgi:hypothetical protein
MNTKQIYLLVASTILLLLNCISLPYSGELGSRNIMATQHLGYFPLYAPPTKEDIWNGFGNRTKRFSRSNLFNSGTSHIVVLQVLMQSLAIMAVAAGLFLVLADKESKPSNYNKT